MSDQKGARLLLTTLVPQGKSTPVLPDIRVLWTDRGYLGPLKEWIDESVGWQMEVAPKRTKETAEADFWQSVKERKQAGVTAIELYAGLLWKRTVCGTLRMIPKLD